MENQEINNAIQQFIKALIAPIVKEEVERALKGMVDSSPIFQLRVEEITNDMFDAKIEDEVEMAIEKYDFRDAVNSAIDNYDFHDFSEQIKEAVAEALEGQPDAKVEVAKTLVKVEVANALRSVADAITIGPKIV